MRLLSCVSSHVHHQHVLRLEGLLLARAILPATHERLLIGVDVVVIEVLRKKIGTGLGLRYGGGEGVRVA